MRPFGILTATFIAICHFPFALADSVETPPPNTALEPLTMSARQRTIPDLLVGGKGIGRRQIDDYCSGRTYCGLGYKCCSDGDGCCGIAENCVRDFLGRPGCCPIGSTCGGPAPDPITYTWTSRTTSTYTSTRTRSTSSTSLTTTDASHVTTNTPGSTVSSATTSTFSTSTTLTSTTLTSTTTTSTTTLTRTYSTTATTQTTQTAPGGSVPIAVSGTGRRVEGGFVVALWTTAILFLI